VGWLLGDWHAHRKDEEIMAVHRSVVARSIDEKDTAIELLKEADVQLQKLVAELHAVQAERDTMRADLALALKTRDEAFVHIGEMSQRLQRLGVGIREQDKPLRDPDEQYAVLPPASEPEPEYFVKPGAAVALNARPKRPRGKTIAKDGTT